jgi:LPS-assembly protein
MRNSKIVSQPGAEERETGVGFVHEAIIIAALMLRSGSSSCRYWALWITGLALGVVARAGADEKLICPTAAPTLTHATTATAIAGAARIDPHAPIDITSDEAVLGVGGDAELKGNVHVLQGERDLHASHAHYDPKRSAFELQGGVEYSDALVHVTGVGGNYAQNEGADFTAAEFELRQRSARGAADVMHLTPDGKIRLEHVRFTTCPKEDPAWQLRANAITLDTHSRIGTARDAKINFKGVPILYLPWVSFPLSNDRKSGFLFPTLGNSTTSGLQLAVPYYWNIAPNVDATLEPMEYQKRGIDFGGELRYLTGNQHGDFAFNFLPNDTLANENRSHVKLQHVAELPDDFRLTINAENVSDPQYFEDFSQGAAATSTAFLERTARVSYRDENWRISGELQQFQTIDESLAPIDRPYAHVPRIVADGNFAYGSAEQLRYGFDSELVDFTRSVGVKGWRFDLLPAASLDFSAPGFFVRPGIAWRFTQYELTDTEPGQERAPSRALPTAKFDTGLLFEREAGATGSRLLTLEPRILYVYTPYRQQEQLPLFDTALPDLNLVELFRTNRYVGADRVGDADQVSVGATSRLLDAKDGTQFLAATLGQIYYFKAPRVVLPNELPETGSSNMVAQLALTAYKHWSANLDLEWNPRSFQGERTEVSVQYHPAPEEVLNFTYRLQRDRLKQLETSGTWPIGRQWNLYGRIVYSLLDNRALDRFAGFEYGACCWRLRLVGRRFLSTRTGQQDTGVFVQLELAGLASVGSAADALLTEAIPGYKPSQVIH